MPLYLDFDQQDSAIVLLSSSIQWWRHWPCWWSLCFAWITRPSSFVWAGESTFLAGQTLFVLRF